MTDNEQLDLGAIYSKDSTTFRVYAPTRDKIDILVTDDYRKVRKKKFGMEKNAQGIFETTIKGDLDGYFYSYLVEDKWEVTDPYSKSSSINSIISAVIDLEKTNPKNFKNSKRAINKEEDAIIYELNIKDYTAMKNSGVINKNRGKYLGLSEIETEFEGYKTGLSNLKELGITHIQILPFYDFITVDENNEFFFDDDNYNWGYDPELYFSPEGSYATDPKDPHIRIKELKTMIDQMHKEGFNVIMDVVYNHTYKSKDSNFEILYPGYYHRIDQNGNFSNGSGVGNEISSEKTMVRKLIIDSLLYWVNEFKVDGFRFDLMALIDIDTIKIAIKELKKINPNIIIYGEPWMALSTPLPLNKQVLPNSQRSNGFALFNSDFRDAIKGDNDGYVKGFIQGDYYLKNRIETGIAGSIYYDDFRNGFCDNADETINYFNCHDNLILQDKLLISLEDHSNIKDITKLAISIILLSFGKPFFFEGNEFLNSKNKVKNAYNAPLSVNAIDWSLKKKNYDVFNYMKTLIKLRKNIKSFKLTKAKEIRSELSFIENLNDNLIGYTLKKEKILIIFNAANHKEIIDRCKILEYFGYKDTTIRQIFSKNGEINRQIVGDLAIDPISTNIYRIGELNGL
ncbi:MAG: type I pullulanase [Tissierellia bacterium]|nr:type I pullulanase [Tissierellia bacterium]